jgi:hypothetical protein
MTIPKSKDFYLSINIFMAHMNTSAPAENGIDRKFVLSAMIRRSDPIKMHRVSVKTVKNYRSKPSMPTSITTVGSEIRKRS